MSISNDSLIISLVYNYLVKKCPKSAKTFSKSTKPKPLPAGTSTLEDILNQRSLIPTVSKETNFVSQKSPQKSKLEAKQKLSSEDYDSEAEENVLKKSSTISSNKLSPKIVAAKKQSSSEDSSSEDEKEIPKKQPIKKQIKAVQLIKKQESSSDDSSSDSKLEAKKNVMPKADNFSSAIAKFAEMSDSSSDSEDEIVSLAKKPTAISIVGNTSLLSNKKPVNKESSSSDSDAEPMKKVTKVTSDGIKGNKTPQKKDSDSSDSSSDSDKEASTKSNMLLKGANKISDSVGAKNTQVKPQTPKKVVASKKQASSSDSSDSESDSKPSNVKFPSKIVSIPLTKSPVKTGNINTIVKNVNDVSSSDSSSDEEEIKGSVMKKNMSAGGVAKKNSSSSDSEEEPSKKKDLKGKPNPASPKEKALTSKKPMQVQKEESSSDDSSSDGEVKANNSNLKLGGIFTKSHIPKKESSSSDSSSEDDKQPSAKANKGASPLKKLTPAKLTSPSKKMNVPISKQSSSDDSSDEEKLVTKTVLQQNKKLSLPMKVQKQESSSEDSSDSESASKPKVASKNNFSPALKGTPTVNSKKTIPGIVAGKSPIQKKQPCSSDSSSDSSDSDAPKKTTVLQSKSPFKLSTPNAAKIARESSSDSDSDSSPENKVKPNALKNTSVVVKNEDSSSSSDEDSDDAAKSKPVVNSATKSKPLSSLKRKHGASDESTDSSDSECEPHTPSQLSTQPHKKQKLNVSNIYETNTPIASDSTKKRRGSSPFRRIKDENFVVDHRMQKSSAEAKHFIPSLGASKGKQFRHEKTKKKRNNSAGKIDMSVNSIKFE